MEQGPAGTEACALAKVWESNDRPYIDASVISECRTVGALHVIVRADDGTVLGEGNVATTLDANQPTPVRTPSFAWPAAGGRVQVEFVAHCADGSKSTRAACVLPAKDPPVTFTVKDPPPTGSASGKP